MFLAWAGLAWADVLRVATYHAPLSRKGPGLLLRDLAEKPDDFAAVLAPIHALSPDVLVLTNLDYDQGGAALTALQALLRQGGTDLPYAFSRLTNSGLPSGRDLDGDGRLGTARDAQGYGWFPGDGGLAILSRLPFAEHEAIDFSALLWRDLPKTRMAADDPTADVQRLSSSGHWVVPLHSNPRISLLVFAATPPVFDGPEDRNGRRNADEVALWTHLLAGKLEMNLTGDFVLAGLANLDPTRGEGLREAMQTLLAHPRMQDPAPQGPHQTATADWAEPSPGKLRVSYVLPSRDLQVLDSGVYWAEDGTTHKLVWVDLRLSP